MEREEYIGELEGALIDLLDGSDWYEIDQYTGLGSERCKEIKNLFLRICNK